MRIEITRAEPAFGGISFADVGTYEKVAGRAHGALDPADPLNAGIINLDRAPTNEAGLVEYACDFYLLRPTCLRQGNGTMLYDALNRGNKVALHSFNDSPRDSDNPLAMAVNDPSSASDAGNGFLMRQGFTLLWSGWQGNGVIGEDALMSAQLPFATDGGGTHRR